MNSPGWCVGSARGTRVATRHHSQVMSFRFVRHLTHSPLVRAGRWALTPRWRFGTRSAPFRAADHPYGERSEAPRAHLWSKPKGYAATHALFLACENASACWRPGHEAVSVRVGISRRLLDRHGGARVRLSASPDQPRRRERRREEYLHRLLVLQPHGDQRRLRGCRHRHLPGRRGDRLRGRRLHVDAAHPVGHRRELPLRLPRL